MMLFRCLCGLTVTSCSEIDWTALWKSFINTYGGLLPCTHGVKKSELKGESNAGQGTDLQRV